MTYASGGLIEAVDYNNFAASVNAIWGTGSGDRGYGQTDTVLRLWRHQTLSLQHNGKI
jgi:hypothetical protein